jgi:DNA-binding response OmpR family regulator
MACCAPARSGAAVDHVASGTEADAALMTNNEFDLLILDLGLPKMHGLEVLRKLRGARLGAAGADPDRRRQRGRARQGPGLRRRRLHGQAVQPAGAGSPRARLTRRGMGGASSTIKHGPLVYDQAGRVATIDGKMVELSARELGLLEVLLQRAGRLVSKDQLVERLCEWGEEVSNNAIEVYIHRLRKKIEKGPDPHRHRARPGLLPRKIPLNWLISSYSRPSIAPPIFQMGARRRETLPARAALAVRRDPGLDAHAAAAAVAVSLALTWLVAQGIAGKPFDRALEYNVRAGAAGHGAGRAAGAVQPAAAGRARSCAPTTPTSSTTRCWGRAAKLLWRRARLPLPPRGRAPPLPGEVRLRDDDCAGGRARGLHLGAARPAGTPLALVQVAETREKRSVLATEIIKGVMLPQFVILPLAVLLVWLALARGIKPLNQLEERIRARKPDDLSPLDDNAVPLEVAPLVSSVNDLLTRLNDSIATQKRFLADAAHQLKTPLAGLRMQADLAQREGTSADELKQSLQQIGAPASAPRTPSTSCWRWRAPRAAARRWRASPATWPQLTIEVVQDSVPRAMDKRIDLGYDGAEPGAPGVGWTATPRCSRS